MKKHLGLFFGLFLVSTALAQESKEMKALNPEHAIEMALSEPLAFVGTFIPYDSVSKMPACLYRNSKVTLMYRYCTKTEAPAVSITIHPADLDYGHLEIYAEGSDKPISEQDRSDYLYYQWKVFTFPNGPNYDPQLSANKYKNYDQEKGQSYVYACFVNRYYDAAQPGVVCHRNYGYLTQSWSEMALSFWNKPSQNWYSLQRTVRADIKKRFENLAH